MTRRERRLRPTIRLRLTVLYGVLFTVAAALLITISYLAVANQVGPRTSEGFEQRRERLADLLDVPVEELPEQGPPSPEGRESLRAAFESIERDVRSEFLDELLFQSLVAFAFTGAGSVALAWYMAGRALRPVDEMARAAHAISEETFDRRIDVEGPDDELRRLAETFNEMLDRLERAFETQRNFAADASHELRTPLAVLRAKADNVLSDEATGVATRTLARDVQLEVDRADRLVDALITLARADARSGDHEPIDLARVVGDVVGTFAKAADVAGIDLDLELGDALLTGDRPLLERLVSNLIDNALQHNIRAGWVRVSVATEGDHAELTVANSGAMLSDDDVEVMFERFYRTRDQSSSRRSGHGLGMAIIREVADAHGATITVEPHDDGGMTAKIRFPPARVAVGS